MSNVGKNALGIADFLHYNEWEADASDRTLGTLNHPTFILQKEVSDLVGFKVIEAEIPFTYYVINPTNQTFTLTEPGGTNAPITITLPVGNYTGSSITQALQTALAAGTGVIRTYTVTLTASTGKLRIASSANEAFVLTFGTTGDFGASNPRLWLGMAAGANTATAGVLVAPSVALLSGPSYLYLCSTRLGLLNNDTLRRGDLAQSGAVVAKIPVNTNPGGTIMWSDPDTGKYFEVDAAQLTSVDFYLAFGGVGMALPEVDLNGVAFSVKIGLITADTQVAKRSGGTLMSGRAKRVLLAE